MKRLAGLALSTLALVLAGCGHKPIGTPSATIPALFLQLTAQPAQLYTSQASVGRTVYFTLDVDNQSKTDFTGTATTGPVIHVVVSSGDKIIWEGPELALPEEKAVRIEGKPTTITRRSGTSIMSKTSRRETWLWIASTRPRRTIAF